MAALAPAAAAQWSRVDTGTLAWLYAIHFVDDQHGWIGGSSGTLLSTTDGGKIWKPHRLPAKGTVRDIYFRDRQLGWLLCERDQTEPGSRPNRSYLLKTQDGGINWRPIEFTGTSERFVRMHLGRGGEIYLAGEGGVMLVLADGGSEEKYKALPARYLILGISEPAPSRLVLVGGGGSIIRTDDGGSTWRQAVFTGEAPESRLNSVFFIDGRNGWAAGNRGKLASTADGGITWRLQPVDTASDLLDIEFRGQAGVAVGAGGTILRSKNAGQTWIRENSGVRHRLERIAFAGGKVFAVGFGGTLITAGADSGQ